MTEAVKYPQVKVKIIGGDGNAFVILGKCKQALVRHKVSKEQVDLFLKEATSGDYNKLLETCANWVSLE